MTLNQAIARCNELDADCGPFALIGKAAARLQMSELSEYYVPSIGSLWLYIVETGGLQRSSANPDSIIKHFGDEKVLDWCVVTAEDDPNVGVIFERERLYYHDE